MREYKIELNFCSTFSKKCAKCFRPISSMDWARRAKNLIFHLACFSCDFCDRQLSTGEDFALLAEQILCREHYLDTVEVETGSSDGNEFIFHIKEIIFDLQQFDFIRFIQEVLLVKMVTKRKSKEFERHLQRNNLKSFNRISKLIAIQMDKIWSGSPLMLD